MLNVTILRFVVIKPRFVVAAVFNHTVFKFCRLNSVFGRLQEWNEKENEQYLHCRGFVERTKNSGESIQQESHCDGA